MKKLFVMLAVVFILCMVLGAAFFLFSQKTALSYAGFARYDLEKLTVLKKPPPQPQTMFQDSEGQNRSLEDFRGRVVLLNVWATWCPPCLEELPGLDALAERYKDQDFDVIAVSVDRDFTDALSFLEDLGIKNLKAYSDPKFTLAARLKARGVPITVLYDRKGRELARLSGGAKWDGETAHALIEKVLEKKP